jgi:predicted MFS family arabinose efflux permease
MIMSREDIEEFANMADVKSSDRVSATLRGHLITREFALLLLTGALGMTTLNLVFPILPLVIAQTGDRAGAGVVTAVVAACTIVLELRTAALLRRFGETRLLVAALLVQMLAMAGFAIVPGLPAMLVFGALAGAGFGTVATVTASAAGNLAPPGRHGEAIGYYGLAASVPTIIAPPAGLLLLNSFGPSAVFATGVAVCAVGAILATRIRAVAITVAVITPGGVVATMRRPAVMAVWLAFVCTTITYGATVSFTPLFLGTKGWGSATVFLFLFGISRLVTRVGSGRFIDRFGERRLVLPSLLLGALALSLLPFRSPALVVVSAALYGSAFGIVQTGAFVEMLRVTGVERSASVSGIWNMGVDAGFGTGALLLAPVAVVLGYSGMFWLLPMLFGLAFLIRWLAGGAAGGPTEILGP